MIKYEPDLSAKQRALVEASKAEIRAIFSNEIECLDETEQGLAPYLLFRRQIRLAGMNRAAGQTAVCEIVYAIRLRDGFWEQAYAFNGPWH